MSPSPTPTATVWCRSERHYAERPVALLWEGRHVQIQRILAQWREPNGPVFRVLGHDGGVYVLRYDEARDAWQITP
jgi:hypothetical protein